MDSRTEVATGFHLGAAAGHAVPRRFDGLQAEVARLREILEANGLVLRLNGRVNGG